MTSFRGKRNDESLIYWHVALQPVIILRGSWNHVIIHLACCQSMCQSPPHCTRKCLCFDCQMIDRPHRTLTKLWMSLEVKHDNDDIWLYEGNKVLLQGIKSFVCFSHSHPLFPFFCSRLSWWSQRSRSRWHYLKNSCIDKIHEIHEPRQTFEFTYIWIHPSLFCELWPST